MNSALYEPQQTAARIADSSNASSSSTLDIGFGIADKIGLLLIDMIFRTSVIDELRTGLAAGADPAIFRNSASGMMRTVIECIKMRSNSRQLLVHPVIDEPYI